MTVRKTMGLRRNFRPKGKVPQAIQILINLISGSLVIVERSWPTNCLKQRELKGEARETLISDLSYSIDCVLQYKLEKQVSFLLNGRLNKKKQTAWAGMLLERIIKRLV